MLNGGLWRVRFSVTRKLLILERETGFEPATSSLGSWHSSCGANLVGASAPLLVEDFVRRVFSNPPIEKMNR